jgi:hypothetical protein
MIDDTQYVWLEYTNFSVIVAFINDLIGVFFLRLMPKKVNRKKLTNQKLMIAIAMIALFTAIGSMSIGSMSNNNALARSSSDDGNTDDQQQGSSDNGGSSDSGLSHKQKLHDQLEENGLCPPGHECSCTPASGVFHDHTTGFNINTGCTSDKG